MSPNIDDELSSISYEFQDTNDSVVLKLYAASVVIQKDLEISTETDYLEVVTPAGETWKFDLYDHIFTDRIEVTTKLSDNGERTTIELRLFKQQTLTVWPHIQSTGSIPLTPRKARETENATVLEARSKDNSPEVFDVSLKKFPTRFRETLPNSATLYIKVRQAYQCHVAFTETNFTATFCTKDDQILDWFDLAPDTLIRLFVRVKERIKPAECSYEVFPLHIKIVFMKENQNDIKWNQLEAEEYSGYSFTSKVEPRSSTLIFQSGYHRILPVTRATYTADNPSSMISGPTRVFEEDTMSSSKISTLERVEPGCTGIYNPANSCFMNAAVQCLSNTRELRDYFLYCDYTKEINRTNPLGMNGAMAEEFASVIANLWSGKSSYIIASRLRDLVAKRHQEFVGTGQHDAQELLTVLLDALHEDLNRIMNKPFVPSIEANNRPDEIVAEEFWRAYLSRNDSIIVQLFTGQFKSKTKCPKCHTESVTFDPFTSVSIPMPKYISVDSIVLFQNNEKPPTKYRLVLSSDASILEVKHRLSSKCGLPVDKMFAYKMPSYHSLVYLSDSERVSSSTFSWSILDMILIAETMTSAECNGEPIIHLTFFQRIFRVPEYVSACGYCKAAPKPDSAPEFCEKCYRESYCDKQCRTLHAKDHKHNCGFRFDDNYETIGLPFVISLPQSKLTCDNVFKKVTVYAKQSVDIIFDDQKLSQQQETGHDSYRNAYHYTEDYDRLSDDDNEEDNFSDIEQLDESMIRSTLLSYDSWSIVRLGDYFVKKNKYKRHCHGKHDRKDKLSGTTMTNDSAEEKEEAAIVIHESSSMASSCNSSITEDFDMLDDICGKKPLFRLMPRTSDDTDTFSQAIINCSAESDDILRSHNFFYVDWYTDNREGAAFCVKQAKDRTSIVGLIEDESVTNSATGDQEVTLQQCLQQFIEPEILSSEDTWYCPNCKEHIQAEKKMSLWRLPPILIIHLKRFKYNQYSSLGYMSSSREKIETPVKFPFYNLNMAPYCSSVSDNDQQAHDASSSTYDLYGIINHRGTSWFGHYTSYARLLSFNDPVKTEVGWRDFNDQYVSPHSDIKDMVRSDAYVLFYRHRHLTVDFSALLHSSNTLQEEIAAT